MLHQDATIADGIHIITNWIAATAAARLALVTVAADVHKVCYQTDTASYYILTNNVGPVWSQLSLGVPSYTIPVAVSDEITALTTGIAKVTFRMPRVMALSSIKGSLSTAQGAGTLLSFDVKSGGVSVFTTLPTFNNTSKTTVGATTPSVITANTVLAADAEITIDIPTVGDGTAKGLKVYLIGT